MASRLIVHVIHRLGVGGLENGLVNLINHLSVDNYRHTIICLTEAGEFKDRLKRRDVPIYELHKREGQDLWMYVRLYRLLRKLRPAIVHTRNLAAVECQLSAWLAKVPVRIHGEHGWDVFDPEGNKRKYQWLRRAFRPLIHAYIPLSRQLEEYLIERVRVPRKKITRICNGVDTERFLPPETDQDPIPDCPFHDPESVLIGTVGRMHGVKDQTTLVKAFIRLIVKHPECRQKVRLICVGNGPLRQVCHDLLEKAGMIDLTWLPGERDDINHILRILDIFVLPSRAEGISNTILEAMATGLPVIATLVGGNPELVEEGVSGSLVAAGDEEAMSNCLYAYVNDPDRRQRHGKNGLNRVREQFSLARMVSQYDAVYRQLMEKIH